MSSRSFFTTDDGLWFQPTEHCRGPWDPDACHAGPPTGLIARALEQHITKQRLTRLSVEIFRPIPHAGFRLETETVRSGRTVTVTRATLLDAQGKACVSAAGLHLSEIPRTPLPSWNEPVPGLADALPGPFPLSGARHGLPAFNGTGVELRYPPGEDASPGPTRLWMRTVPLLPDESPSPFQRICPLADCGNAISRNAEPEQVSFLNPDLTIVLHRDPVGEWLGSSARSHWQSNGIGLADALLFDEQGVVGRAVQTLLLRPM